VSAGRAAAEASHLFWRPRIVLLTFVSMLGAVLVWRTRQAGETASAIDIIASGLLITLAGTIMMLALSTLVAPLTAVLRSHPAAFGWDDLRYSWKADVRIALQPWNSHAVERVSSDTWRVRISMWREVVREYGVGALIAHSLLYADPKVVNAIARHARRVCKFV